MRKHNENPLSNRPTGLLNVNLAGRSGWCVRRLQKRQPIETMYEDRMATSDTEVMLLSAIVLPMLMRASRQVTTHETMMEFIGTSQPGGTYANQEAPGTP